MVGTADSHATDQEFKVRWNLTQTHPSFFLFSFLLLPIMKALCILSSCQFNPKCQLWHFCRLTIEFAYDSSQLTWHHIKRMGLTLKMQVMMENSTKNISIQTEFDSLPRSMTFESCVSHGKIWVNSLKPINCDCISSRVGAAHNWFGSANGNRILTKEQKQNSPLSFSGTTVCAPTNMYVNCFVLRWPCTVVRMLKSKNQLSWTAWQSHTFLFQLTNILATGQQDSVSTPLWK